MYGYVWTPSLGLSILKLEEDFSKPILDDEIPVKITKVIAGRINQSSLYIHKNHIFDSIKEMTADKYIIFANIFNQTP